LIQLWASKAHVAFFGIHNMKANRPKSYTLEPIQAPATQPTAERPVWIRLPPPGKHEFFTRLGRAHLSNLCAQNKIKSVSLREPHATRGIRLINLQSALDYIGKFDTGEYEAVPIDTRAPADSESKHAAAAGAGNEVTA